MENGVNCDGKSWKSHVILLSVFCGNPVYNVRVGMIHRCIDISRYLSRDSYRDTLGNHFDLKTTKNNFFFNAAGLGHALPKMMCLLAVRRGIDAKAPCR